MAKFVIGKKDYLLQPLNLRSSRLAFRLLPEAQRTGDPDQLLGAMILVLEDAFRDEYPEVTAEFMESSLRGLEIQGLIVSMTELMEESGFRAGELQPMLGAEVLRGLMPSSTGSSSASDERASGAGETLSETGPS